MQIVQPQQLEDCVPSVSNSNNQMPLKPENSGGVRSKPALMSHQGCKVNVYHNNHHQINKLIIICMVEKVLDQSMDKLNPSTSV